MARLPLLLLLLLLAAAALWREPARALPSGQAPEQPGLGLVLYNEAHFHLVGLAGMWEVSASSAGSRLRPAHSGGSVQLLDLLTGEVLERRIPFGGEFALANGWIAVNPGGQDTF